MHASDILFPAGEYGLWLSFLGKCLAAHLFCADSSGDVSPNNHLKNPSEQPFLDSSFPQLQLSGAKKRCCRFPAAIPPAPFLSGGREGAGEGGGPGNRCADVYRLGSWLPRSRICLPSVFGGGPRSCREEVAPLRDACPGGVGEAVAAAARRNNAPTPPRPVGS
jgi:hypothetical protein